MTQKNTQILKQKQDELIDQFILNTEKIETIMKSYVKILKNFHRYSLNNLILANYQLYEKNGNTIELLAPYKKWGSVNRNVKKGEKALYILAPIQKIIRDEETDEIIGKKIAYFKRVPVFDLSQTEGENIEKDYTTNFTGLTFETIKSKINIPILESDKQLTRGYTDGVKIWISKHLSDSQKICVLFHELGHYYLHFDKKKLTSEIKELEAEAISFMISSALGISNEESSTYIKSWAGKNSPNLIKGRGQKLLKTASKILDDLELSDYIVSLNETKY